MLLKRLYDHSDPKNPKVRGVRVLRAGAGWNISPDLLQRGAYEGWLSLAKGQVVLEAEGQALRYRVNRGPGYYCCHCGEAVDDGPSARAHIAAEHASQASPDPSNPAGYCRINHYECVREG